MKSISSGNGFPELVKGMNMRADLGVPDWGPEDHSEFLAAHPLPTLQDAKENEVFGPLMFRNTTFFRVYDAPSGAWSVVPGISPARAIKQASCVCNHQHIEQYNALVALPSPLIPRQIDKELTVPWNYNGAQWSWTTSPGEAEWYLAVRIA